MGSRSHVGSHPGPSGAICSQHTAPLKLDLYLEPIPKPLPRDQKPAVCRRENLSVRNFVVVELARRFGRASSATTTRC
ncbi:MAG: hypothetical protein QME81_19165, partial [bacterium]|nr:hypothetical protein [bacterium]